MSHLTLIGAGHVGLVTAVCFAEAGHHVFCVDIDHKKIDLLNAGRCPLAEPALAPLLIKQLDAGRLAFTTNYKEALSGSDLCFLAVDTPPAPDGSADLSSLNTAIASIATHMTANLLIVNKSTVPMGTAKQLEERLTTLLLQQKKDYRVTVVSNPEFLRAGSAVDDALHPSRIIIGADSSYALERMKAFYAPHSSCLITMSRESAELTKYGANAMLATRLTLMNELALLAEEGGADIDEVVKGIGADERIGPHYLQPGPGYGGCCLPKDIDALCSMRQATPVLEGVRASNLLHQRRLGEKILSYFHNDLKGKTIGIWGLAFKPGTDIIKNSPAMTLLNQLIEAGAHIRLFDPLASCCLPHVTLCSSPEEAAMDASAIALMTAWEIFQTIRMEELLSMMDGNAFFDARNQYNPLTMQTLGFDYFPWGKQPLPAHGEHPYDHIREATAVYARAH